ncbi:MAG: hypothetical protein ABIA74_03750 [bacterium]
MKFIKKTFCLVLFLSTFIVSELFSLPLNNFYDQAIFYNVRGVDKYYFKKQPWFTFDISPYMQCVSGCRGWNGTRKDADNNNWGEGDRLGWWNMLGLFYGRDASPTDNKFELIQGELEVNTPPSGDYQRYLRYPDLVLSGVVVDGDTATKIKNDATSLTVFTQKEIDESVIDKVDLATGPDSADKILYNFTDETNFDVDDKFGRLSVPIDFEKIGLRSKLNFVFGQYFGANVKTGVCYYKQRPTFVDKTSGQQGKWYQSFPNATEKSKTLVQTYLTDEEKIEAIANEVGLDVNRYSKTAMEDTHIEFSMNYPIKLEGKDSELEVTFIPILAVGVWAPSGSNFKQDYAFSLPTGNDGFLGLTVDGSLNLDFPGTIQLGFGLGGAYFEKKDLENQRVPSSMYQYGIYPWKTDIKKQPGATWYANFSMMGQIFIEGFSFYFDLIHTEHRKDTIELKQDNAYFKPQKMIDESSWRAEHIFMGLDYKVAPACSIGISFQSLISGARVYRTTTILGSMTLNF